MLSPISQAIKACLVTAVLLLHSYCVAGPLADRWITIDHQSSTKRELLRQAQRSLGDEGVVVYFILEGGLEEEIQSERKSFVSIQPKADLEEGFSAGVLLTEPADQSEKREATYPTRESLSTFLSTVARKQEATYRIDDENGRILIRAVTPVDVYAPVPENQLVEHPLDAPLRASDATREMTYKECLKVLTERYGLDLPPVFDLGSPDFEFLCPCNEVVAWRGGVEEAVVRDLLLGVLDTANKCQVERFGRPLNHQIKSRYLPGHDRVTWIILSF